MDRTKTIALLQAHEAPLKRLGVQTLFLFGSVARDEATSGSDVDLFFDYERGAFSLFQLMDVKAYAASILGCRTDIMTRDSLHEVMRPDIENSAVQVF